MDTGTREKLLCGASSYKNRGVFILCEKGEKLNGPQEAPWSPCLNEGQLPRSTVSTRAPSATVPATLVRDSRGHPVLWDRRGPCALLQWLPMATHLSSSAGTDRNTTGWGRCCAHGQQLRTGQGDNSSCSCTWRRVDQHPCAQLCLAEGQGASPASSQDGGDGLTPSECILLGRHQGNTTTTNFRRTKQVFTLLLFLLTFPLAHSRAGRLPRADQQTGHQLGTLNLLNPFLTKANVSATAPTSCKPHWVPLMALGARK